MVGVRVALDESGAPVAFLLRLLAIPAGGGVGDLLALILELLGSGPVDRFGATVEVDAHLVAFPHGGAPVEAVRARTVSDRFAHPTQEGQHQTRLDVVQPARSVDLVFQVIGQFAGTQADAQGLCFSTDISVVHVRVGVNDEDASEEVADRANDREAVDDARTEVEIENDDVEHFHAADNGGSVLSRAVRPEFRHGLDRSAAGAPVVLQPFDGGVAIDWLIFNDQDSRTH